MCLFATLCMFPVLIFCSFPACFSMWQALERCASLSAFMFPLVTRTKLFKLCRMHEVPLLSNCKLLVVRRLFMLINWQLCLFVCTTVLPVLSLFCFCVRFGLSEAPWNGARRRLLVSLPGRSLWWLARQPAATTVVPVVPYAWGDMIRICKLLVDGTTRSSTLRCVRLRNCSPC